MKIHSKVVVCLLSCLMLGSCVRQQRTPSLYIVPSGYVGSARVFYDQKDAPLLREVNGYVEVPIINGRCRTSSSMRSGWAKDQYVYQKGSQQTALPNEINSSNRMIWNQGTAKSNSSRMKRMGKGEGKYYYDPQESIVFYEFFVGSEEQHKSHEKFGD